MLLSCRGDTVLRIRIFCLIFIALFFFAQPDASNAGVEEFSPGAKTIGIGHSGVVGIYDASALFWNPAALSAKRVPQGFISIHEPFTLNYLSYSHFVPKLGSYALSIASTWMDEHPTQSATIGWGHELIPGFSTGLNINGFECREQTWASFGVGILYRPIRSLRRTLHKSPSPRSSYIANRLAMALVLYNVPLGRQYNHHQIRCGLSYDVMSSGPTLVYAHHFSPAVDSDHLGLLFNPTSHIQVYTGIRNFDARNFSFGGGFEWDNIDVQLSYDALTNRLVFSSSIRIGAHPRRIADRYYNQAIESLKKRYKQQALRQCELALLYDENHSRAYSLEKNLQTYIARETVKIDSLLIAAQIYQNQQNFLPAAAQYLKILKIDPNNREAQEAIAMIRPKVNIDVERWYQQAINAYNEGNIERAEELFEAIILVRPDHFGSKSYLVKIQSYYSKIAEQHYFAGLGYYSQRKLDAAETEFKKALAIDPDLEDASTYLSRIDDERIQNEKQISTLLDEAQRLEENQMWAGALRAYRDILKIQPDHSFALQHLQQLESIISTTAERYFTRGKIAYNNGDFTKALDHFNTVLSIDPSHAGARQLKNAIASSQYGRSRQYIDRARYHVNRQNWRQAIVMADSALAINPSHAEAAEIKTHAATQLDVQSLLVQARAEYNSARYLEALELLEVVLDKDPEHAEAQKLLENCQLELHTQVDVLFNLGIQLYTEEKYQQAIDTWNTVLKINPYHKGALDYKAKAQEGLDILKNLP
ncbi:tetratricopeptide repeat protein [candidate division KSB1 bacterium]|nr:tetratricopeptide repeat protein [candidate division KSB1 bacterium]